MYGRRKTMIKYLAIVILVGVAFADPIPMPSFGNVPTRRILGGSETSIEHIPYQVSIWFAHRGGATFMCGGSIISENWVLSAAHCFKYAMDRYYVRSGSTLTDTDGTIHKISRIINHENFMIPAGATMPQNDIALIEVATPFLMGTTRQAIELFKSGEEVKPGMEALISGWGSIQREPRKYPAHLQFTSVPIVSKSTCKEAWGLAEIVHPDQICAGYDSGAKDTCSGDSGGPLVIEGRLAGITSSGSCGRPGRPAVYTEVAHFREWIKKHAGI